MAPLHDGDDGDDHLAGAASIGNVPGVKGSVKGQLSEVLPYHYPGKLHLHHTAVALGVDGLLRRSPEPSAQPPGRT